MPYLKINSPRLIANALLVSLFYISTMASPALAQQTGFQGGKNWQVKVTGDFIQETNLVQNPGGLFLFNNRNDSGFRWSADGTYIHQFSDKWSLEGNYNLDITVYQDLGQYDTISNAFTLKPRYKFKPNLFLDFQYMYMHNVVGGNNFSGVNLVSPSLSHIHPKWGLTQINFAYTNTDNFVNQGRDADEFGGGFMHYYLFPGTRHHIGAGYQISGENTAGNFDRTVHDFKLRGKVGLPMGIDFNGRYKFSHRDYDTFAATGGGIRDDDRHTFGLKFSKMLWSKLFFLNKVKASLGWTRIHNNSNTLFRDFINNRFQGGITARF